MLNLNFVVVTSAGASMVPYEVFYKVRRKQLVIVGKLKEQSIAFGEKVLIKGNEFQIKEIQKDKKTIPLANPNDEVGIEIAAKPKTLKDLGIFVTSRSFEKKTGGERYMIE